MTFRNLNGDWVTTLTRQYRYDLKEGCVHPIKYLLFDHVRRRNIFYYIPNPIDVDDLRKSLVKYKLITRNTSTFEWEDQHIQIWPHSGDRNDSDPEEQLPQVQDRAPNRFEIAAAASAAAGRIVSPLPPVSAEEKTKHEAH